MALALVAVAVLVAVLLLPRYLLNWDLAGVKPVPSDRANEVNVLTRTDLQHSTSPCAARTGGTRLTCAGAGAGVRRMWPLLECL